MICISCCNIFLNFWRIYSFIHLFIHSQLTVLGPGPGLGPLKWIQRHHSPQEFSFHVKALLKRGNEQGEMLGVFSSVFCFIQVRA